MPKVVLVSVSVWYPLVAVTVASSLKGSWTPISYLLQNKMNDSSYPKATKMGEDLSSGSGSGVAAADFYNDKDSWVKIPTSSSAKRSGSGSEVVGAGFDEDSGVKIPSMTSSAKVSGSGLAAADFDQDSWVKVKIPSSSSAMKSEKENKPN